MKEKEKRRGRRRRKEEEEEEIEQKVWNFDFCMELWILYGSHGIVSFK